VATRTTSVQKVIDYCSLHTSLQTYFNVGGVTNEPALTICNNTLQMLLSGLVIQNGQKLQKMPWKFNRKELCGPERGGGNFIVTQYGVQDYRWAGASAFVLNSGSANAGGANVDLLANPINGGAAGITVSGGIVTVQTIDPHPFQQGATVFMSGNTVAAYNSTYSFSATAHTSGWSGGWTILTVPNNLHFTFAATVGQTVNSGAPGFGLVDANGLLVSTSLYPFGWLESAYVQDINNAQFPQPIKPIGAVKELPVNYVPSGNPPQVCMLVDYDNGVLKFRLSDPVGSSPWQINLVYQAKAPKLIAPNSIFPWPDDMIYVVNETALAQAFRYAKGIKADETTAQMGISNMMIMSALAGEDREDNAFVVAPEMSLMRG